MGIELVVEKCIEMFIDVGSDMIMDICVVDMSIMMYRGEVISVLFGGFFRVFSGMIIFIGKVLLVVVLVVVIFVVLEFNFKFLNFRKLLDEVEFRLVVVL